MTQLALELPEIGKPDRTQDPKINTAFTQIQTWANGNIDETNLAEGLKGRLGGLKLANHGTSWNGVSGELGAPNVAGLTMTLPSPSVNALVGVVNGVAGANLKVVAAAGTKIYGKWIKLQSSIEVAQYQCVALFGDGANWLIEFGEPRRETAYTETEATRTTATAYEPSTARDTTVVVNALAGGAGAVGALKVGGVQVTPYGVSAGAIANITVKVPAGQTWELTVTSGAVSALKSSYLVE